MRDVLDPLTQAVGLNADVKIESKRLYRLPVEFYAMVWSFVHDRKKTGQLTIGFSQGTATNVTWEERT